VRTPKETLRNTSASLLQSKGGENKAITAVSKLGGCGAELHSRTGRHSSRWERVLGQSRPAVGGGWGEIRQ